MILVETFLSNTVLGSRLGVYYTPPPLTPSICKLTAHSTGQCSQVHRLCSGTHQLPGSHRYGRTWNRRGKGQALGRSRPTLFPSFCPQGQRSALCSPGGECLLGP